MVLLFAMFQPGGMSIDSYEQLLQARHADFGDWHPPFMAWLWRAADALVPGPLPMLLAQLAMFLAGLLAFARQAFPGRPVAGGIFILASLWLMPVSGIVGVIWKDVWASCLLLIAAACLLSGGGTGTGLGEGTRAAALRFRLLAGGLALFGALLFRYNAVFAAVPLLVFAAWRPLTRRAGGRPLRGAAAALAAGLAGSAALMLAASAVNGALAVRQEFPGQSILIYDLAGVAVRTGRTELLDAEPERIPDVLRGRSSVPVEALRAHYYPSTWTPLVFVQDSPLAVTHSAAQVDELAARWRRALAEEPAAYLRHRADVFRQVIGAHPGPLFAPVYFGIPVDSPDHAQVSRIFRIDPDAAGQPARLLREAFTAGAGLVIQRPWLWLLLNLAAIGLALWRSPQGVALAALAASGLGYELALFFIAPSADYRYSHWLVLSTWAVLAALAWEAVACPLRPPVLRTGAGTPAG